MKKFYSVFSILVCLYSSSYSQAQESCNVLVQSNDTMLYVQKEIAIDMSCETVSLTFEHLGKMPVTAMGHNVVISTKDDAKDIVQDGLKHYDNDFIKPNEERIIAQTKMIGGGEKTTITFDPSLFKKGTQYEFFCTFMQHYFMGMKGIIVLQ